MITKNRTLNQTKILDAMKNVWPKLLEKSRKNNSELVVSIEGKIVKIKP